MKYKNRLAYFIFILLLGCQQGQNPNQSNLKKSDNLWLKEKITNADQVILVSHTGISGDEKTNQEIFPKILSNNKINDKIFTNGRLFLKKKLMS